MIFSLQAFLKGVFRFRPVRIGEPVKVRGAVFQFFYSLHSIPCIGFEVSFGGKSIVFRCVDVLPYVMKELDYFCAPGLVPLQSWHCRLSMLAGCSQRAWPFGAQRSAWLAPSYGVLEILAHPSHIVRDTLNPLCCNGFIKPLVLGFLRQAVE